MDIREKAKELLLKNYQATGGKYTCPSWPHYPHQYLWDSCFHAIVYAELGLTDLAKNEIEQLLKWQRQDGWIPHIIYLGQRQKLFDLERRLYKKDRNQFHSSITQPPVIAQAVEAINDPEWTQKILPSILKFYLYFSQKQDPDADGLISVCHPCETGRDTSPDLNFCRPFNPVSFFLACLKLEWQYKKAGWDIEKIWQKNLFNVEDLMFNCIWVDGLRSLYRLIGSYGPEGIIQQAEKIRAIADRSEEAIYHLCWDEKDRIFYNLDSQNKKIRRLTASNLFPLILDNIPEKMHKSLVEHLTNPEEFWTPYPIPSVAKNDPAFDPNHGYYCNWRGPVWINMNWFISKGLLKHGYREIAEKITDKTLEVAEEEGFREFYNPLMGQGLRKLTRGFGWSTLAITLPKILKEN